MTPKVEVVAFGHLWNLDLLIHTPVLPQFYPSFRYNLYLTLSPQLLLQTDQKCSKNYGSLTKTSPSTDIKKEALSPLNTCIFSKATPGFEPGDGGFADLCLTTWLCRQNCVLCPWLALQVALVAIW